MRYLTCVDEGCVTFGNEILVKNRVCAWFFEKDVAVLFERGTVKRPFVIINSMEFSMVSSKRPLYSAAGAVAVVRGEVGEWAGLVSPVRRKRVCESSDVMWFCMSSAV